MILIVDDIQANIIALKKILELHNFEVDSAVSGEEALKKILKRDYSLIILDVQMPGMDGFEVAETLSGSNRTKSIPIIFLSAVNKQKKFISKGYEAGGVDYVTKPVDPDLFILKVKTFYKLYTQQKELNDMHNLLSAEIKIRKEAQENLELKVNERTSELRKKNEELELRNHELQQFAWVVSHDLREPIRKIELFTKLIKERYIEEGSKAVDYIDRTVNAASRMQQLIRDLLDYSRLSSDVAPQQADLNIVINEVLDDLEYLVDQKQAEISVGSLPVINGVPSQLRQVFQNLIGNSLKFSQAEVRPVIEINGERISERSFDSPLSAAGDYCRLTVKDNGIGFDEQYLDKIFVIFQSLNDRKSYEGTGIGLAIAKKIIEKHNGLITAKSSVGIGSEFIILLPIEHVAQLTAI